MGSSRRGGVAFARDATLSAASGEPPPQALDAPLASFSNSGVEVKELAPGTRVGRYEIETAIGRGAMGAVYAAQDPDLARRVAVKLLRADALSEDARQKMRVRLLREAQAMARLSHPEVITVYDVGAFGDQLFVAMEYVEGDTLRRWRAARHRRYEEILAVYERAGSGLAAAHEAGLVHRDFKPDNVLVGHDGRVRVTDFGLARSAAQPPSGNRPVSDHAERSNERPLALTLTRTGSLLGTPAYMAPEQLRGDVADARSDVFSFCVALYEALYGERPFEGSTMQQLRRAIDEGAVRPSPVITRVPAWVRGVLLRGLRSAPEERYASMRALLTALREANARSRRRAWRASLVTTALLGAGAAAGYARGGSRSVHPGAPAAIAPGWSVSAPTDRVPGLPGDPQAFAARWAPVASGAAPVESPHSRPLDEPGKPAPNPAAHPGVPSSHGTQHGASAAPSSAPALGKNGAFILD
jgi:tRNA A-37 threonylcarbamoyl transferase component Bud32